MRKKRTRRKGLGQRGPDPSNSTEQFLEVLIATIDALRPAIESILMEIYPPGRRGRPPGYPPFAMFKAIIFRTQTQSLRGLSRELTTNRKLVRLTGLPKVPPHQTLSNHMNRLGEDRLQRISGLIVKELRQHWPDFGSVQSIDGTVVKAFAKNDKGIRSTSDPDARWGFKEHSKSGRKTLEFGYRLTTSTDARHEVPVTGVTTSANANESPLFPTFLKRARGLELPLDVVVADAQSDSRKNIEIAIGYGAKPVIPLNPRSSKSTKLTGKRKWDAILPIRRNSDEWKRYLRMRVASERVNRSLKSDVGLDTLKVRGLPRVACFFWLGIIMKQLFALSAVQLGKDELARYVMVWCH